jgi:hypothetical protein
MVGSLVQPGLGSKTPATGSRRESWSIVTHREAEGGCIVEGRGWWACWYCLASNCAWEDSLVHAVHVAIHGVGASCRTLIMFAGARARCAGVVVINVATMCMAVVITFKLFYQQRGRSDRGLVACGAATVATAVAVATAVVAAATTVVAAATVLIAASAAAKIAATAAMVSAVVSAATMLLAMAPPAA